MAAIYLINPVGALVGPITLPVVPGIGCQMPDDAIELGGELVAPAEGFVWALVEGEVVQLEDHRGTVYRTDTGEEQEHTELGELPGGLTVKPRPGGFYVWLGDDWALDESAQLQAALLAERGWRNVRIMGTDYLVMPDYPLSDIQRTELYAYRQALRDWPAVGHFPNQDARPVPPSWVSLLDQ